MSEAYQQGICPIFGKLIFNLKRNLHIYAKHIYVSVCAYSRALIIHIDRFDIFDCFAHTRHAVFDGLLKRFGLSLMIWTDFIIAIVILQFKLALRSTA